MSDKNFPGKEDISNNTIQGIFSRNNISISTSERIKDLDKETSIYKDIPNNTVDLDILRRRLSHTFSLKETISSGYLSENIESEASTNIEPPSNVFLDSRSIEQSDSEKFDSDISSASRKVKSINSLNLSGNDETFFERYDKIFPMAKKQMEYKLSEFMEVYTKREIESLNVHPCEKFALMQIYEMARSLYLKSLSTDANLISQYFMDLSSKIEELLNEATLKCPEPINILYHIAQKFNLIISDISRILSCIENNPTKLASFENINDYEPSIQNREMNLHSYFLKALGQEMSPSPLSLIPTSPKVYVSRKGPLASVSIKRHLPNKSAFDASTEKKDQSDVSISGSNDYWMPKESDYKIIKLISQGAFGAVFLVRHATTKKRYALKKIRKSHALLKNQVRQIFAERDILSFTENPFVISMLCSFETKNSFCMVMEYAEGGDCASLLKSLGVLSVDMTRVYIAETIMAIEYIHNYGIIHRDIKPDNLLITAVGHIKLTDFGLSKVGLVNMAAIHSKDYLETFHDQKILGTPDYIAPEVILNRPYGRAIDYWSLGIMLYEFLIGCPPFYGNTIDDLFEAIVSSEIEWPKGDDVIMIEIQSLILAFLERNPQKRLSVNEAKNHIFFNEIKWDALLHTKAEFIPIIKDDEDTSNFDDRSDRYDHGKSIEQNTMDTKIENKNLIFTSFTKRFKDEIIKSAIERNKKSKSRITSVFKNSKNAIDNPNTEFKNSQSSEEIFKYSTAFQIGESSLGNDNYSILERTEESSSESGHLLTSSKNFPSLLSNPNFRKILLERTENTLYFGFAIKTIRIFVNKSISFLAHTVDNVKNNSIAHLAGVKSGMLIIKLNNEFIFGMQHVRVIRMLPSFLMKLHLELCDFQEFGIVSSKGLSIKYYLNASLPYFKDLQKMDICFEGTNEKLNLSSNTSIDGNFDTANVIHSGNYYESQKAAPRSKVRTSNTSNIFKSFMKKLFEQKKRSNYVPQGKRLKSSLTMGKNEFFSSPLSKLATSSPKSSNTEISSKSINDESNFDKKQMNSTEANIDKNLKMDQDLGDSS